jgi:hypothetical protein
MGQGDPDRGAAKLTPNVNGPGAAVTARGLAIGGTSHD